MSEERTHILELTENELAIITTLVNQEIWNIQDQMDMAVYSEDWEEFELLEGEANLIWDLADLFNGVLIEVDA